MSLTKVSYSMIDGSVANVLDYIPASEHAAIGNATSTYDCSSAFNSAIASGKDVFVPVGRYRILSPINFTNKSAGNQKLFGEGWGISNNGSVIQACTGGVAIDCTGSQFISIEDIAIDSNYGTPPTPSTVGILTARSTISQYAQFLTLRNVYIYMAHSTTANHTYGSVGLYNCAAEIHHYDNVYFVADTAIAFNPYNINWAVTSPFTTIDNTIVSMSMISVTGSSTFTSTASYGYSIWCNNAFGMLFENVYLASTAPGTSTTQFEGCTNVKLNAHLEAGTAAHVAEMKNCNTVDIRWTGGPTTVSPIWMGSTFNSLFNINITCNGISPSWPYIIEGLSTSVVNNVHVNITGDDATTPTSNITYTTGVTRVVYRSNTSGGFMFQTVPDSLIFNPYTTIAAPNNSLVNDPATGKISWKDASGVVHALY